MLFIFREVNCLEFYFGMAIESRERHLGRKAAYRYVASGGMEVVDWLVYVGLDIRY